MKVWVHENKQEILLDEVNNQEATDYVAKSQVVVICVSNAYKHSEFCKSEALRAVVLEKMLILANMEKG